MVPCASLAVFGCTSDDSSTGGIGAGSAAKSFCDDYGVICGFDGAGFMSQEDCEGGYNSFSETRQGCVEMDLGLADTSNDTVTHCPHGTGAFPCDMD